MPFIFLVSHVCFYFIYGTRSANAHTCTTSQRVLFDEFYASIEFSYSLLTFVVIVKKIHTHSHIGPQIFTLNVQMNNKIECNNCISAIKLLYVVICETISSSVNSYRCIRIWGSVRQKKNKKQQHRIETFKLLRVIVCDWLNDFGAFKLETIKLRFQFYFSEQLQHLTRQFGGKKLLNHCKNRGFYWFFNAFLSSAWVREKDKKTHTRDLALMISGKTIQRGHTSIELCIEALDQFQWLVS